MAASIVDDETARILAERSPAKWREYALMEAERVRRETITSAYATYEAAGGHLEPLRRALGRRGEPAYDALTAALEAATLDYDQTCGAIQGEYARWVAS